MSRRRAAPKRPIQPDPRYNSSVFGKFINALMLDGKKAVAQSIFYEAMDIIAQQNDAPETVYKALMNVKPSVEVKSRRVGGATYPVPVPVTPYRAQTLCIRWIIDAARKRGEKTMPQRLAAEMIQGAQETGAAFKKRTDIHRMAAANQAFSHFRWS